MATKQLTGTAVEPTGNLTVPDPDSRTGGTWGSTLNTDTFAEIINYIMWLKANAGSGVSDHGALTGLGDDDHSQYHTDARAATWWATKAASQAEVEAGTETALRALSPLRIAQAVEALQDVTYYEFAFAPTIADDGENTSGNGTFSKGDIWRDTADKIFYQCASPAQNTAEWDPIGYANYDALSRQTVPTSTDRVLVRTGGGNWKAYSGFDLARAQFLRESITLNGTATDIDANTALQKAIQVNADTTVDFAGVPVSGNHWEMYWKVTQDGTGGRNITIIPTITWRSGEAPDFTGMAANQVGRVWFWGDSGSAGTIFGDHDIYSYDEIFEYAISSETEDAATGTGVLAFRTPFACNVVDVRLSTSEAPTGSAFIVDINDGGGATILSTKLSIDAGEKTSVTAATPPILTNTAFADDEEATVDIDQVGSTIPGKGAKLKVFVKRVTS